LVKLNSSNLGCTYRNRMLKARINRVGYTYLAVAVVMVVASGGSSAASMFIPYIQKSFSLDAVTPVVISSTISGIVSAALLTLMGSLFDRYGHRPLLAVSAICTFVSSNLVWAMSLQRSWDTARILWYASAVVSGVGFAASTASLIPTVIKWNPHAAGLISATTTAAGYAAQIVWAPTIPALIEAFGVFKAMQIQMIVASIATFIGGVAIIKPPPQTRLGALQTRRTEQSTESGAHMDIRLFSLLFVCMFLIALSSMMLLSLLAPIMAESLSTSLGKRFEEVLSSDVAKILSIAGTMQTAAAVLGGIAIQLRDPLKILPAVYGIEGASALGLHILFGRAPQIWIGLLLLRLTSFALEPALHWALMPRLFGLQRLGRISGALNTAVMVSSTLAPFLGGFIRDRTGSYAAVVLASTLASFTATAAALALIYYVSSSGKR